MNRIVFHCDPMGCDTNLVRDELAWASHFARGCISKLPAYVNHDDLHSAGMLGYVRAAARYDSSRGASFRGYCSVRIRGAVLDELRRWDWAPRSVHKNNRRITRVTSSLTTRFDREPTKMELATELGMNEAELAAYETQAVLRQLVSFDEIADNRDGGECLPLAERLCDPCAPRPDSGLLRAEDRRLLLACLRSLPKMQATIIVLHYLQNVPLRTVARMLAVTPSRISQVHHQALCRLRMSWNRRQTTG